jgi:ATP-dependent Lon protease
MRRVRNRARPASPRSSGLHRDPGDTLQAVLQGMERVQLTGIEEADGVARAHVRPLPGGDESPAALAALAEDVLRRYQRLVDNDDQLAPELITLARHNRENPALLADFVVASLPFSVAERGPLVHEAGTAARLRRVADLLELRVDSARLARQIRDRARTRLEADQRRQLLREQLREIREALGETADSDTLVGFQRRMEELPLSRAARREAERELHRLAGLSVASAEYDVARHHFESLLQLPWNTPSLQTVDLEEFRLHLDAALIGLAPARAEIVEYAAVLRLHGTVGAGSAWWGCPGVGAQRHRARHRRGPRAAVRPPGHQHAAHGGRPAGRAPHHHRRLSGPDGFCARPGRWRPCCCSTASTNPATNRSGARAGADGPARPGASRALPRPFPRRALTERPR